MIRKIKNLLIIKDRPIINLSNIKNPQDNEWIEGLF